VVAGVEVDGGVFLGADSAISDPSIVDTGFRKIHRFLTDDDGRIGFAIGAIGSARASQVIEHWLDVLPPRAGVNPERWAVRELVPALRIVAEEHGPWHADEIGEETSGKSSFYLMVAVKGALLTISDCYTVTRSPSKFAAIGSGAEFAIGSLTTTDELSKLPDFAGVLQPGNRIDIAIKAAARWSPTVEVPIDIVWVPA
jgi:ATP-dependent protease HslVU (ClpYQ) peptidase subunit